MWGRNMPMDKAFKPKPKKGDIEQRTVVSLNSHDELTKDTLKRIKSRPAETTTETRTFLNGVWLDWKITP